MGPSGPKSLLTRWNWQSSGHCRRYGTSQTCATEFDHGGNVRYYPNGQLTRTATYTLQTDPSTRARQPADLVVWSPGLGQHYRIQGQQLLLRGEV